MIFSNSSGLGFKKHSELNKIISTGPEGKYQGPPQKKRTDFLDIKTKKRIMNHQWYNGGDLKTGFVFPQIGG